MANQRIIEEIEDFLYEKVTHHVCNLCGGNDWLIDYAEGYNCSILMVEHNSSNTSFGIPFIVTECDNCGNIRTYSLRAFEKWRNSRK